MRSYFVLGRHDAPVQAFPQFCFISFLFCSLPRSPPGLLLRELHKSIEVLNENGMASPYFAP